MSDVSLSEADRGGAPAPAGLFAPLAGESHATPRDFIALLKPRVMSLVIFTALVGLIRAPGEIHPVIAFTALLCIAVGAGAAGALNMWWDADIDAVMNRTRNRPIPAGKVTPGEALAFGLTLSAFSVVVLGLLVNALAGALLAFTIFFYVVIYSMWLKRATPQNIVIGGAAGAFPPMVAWAAGAGTLSLEPMLMVAIIFWWPAPLSWPRAACRGAGRAGGGVPAGAGGGAPEETRRQILYYTLFLVPLAASPAFLGYAGPVYGAVALGAGGFMIRLALRVFRRREGEAAVKAAKGLFGFSILYLFALFATLLGEAVVRALWP